MKTYQGAKRRPVIAAGLIVVLLALGFPAHNPQAETRPHSPAAFFDGPEPHVPPRRDDEAELTERLKRLCQRAETANVGVAVVHVETGKTVTVGETTPLPLYSVFKLPLAISVLKNVEEGRLRLDQQIRVTPDEAAPGGRANSELWQRPVTLNVAKLLEYSLIRSDNTSSDKLLQLVGGPGAVTERMRALGFQNIDIRSSVREFIAQKEHPNTATASDLAHLLARLERGEILKAPERRVLLGFMRRAVTGLRRIRGRLPAGTEVADKSGTGEAGRATNDVGLVTLPRGRGHLALAVFISGSKLSAEAQEQLIAEIARAAYDAHVAPAAP